MDGRVLKAFPGHPKAVPVRRLDELAAPEGDARGLTKQPDLTTCSSLADLQGRRGVPWRAGTPGQTPPIWSRAVSWR